MTAKDQLALAQSALLRNDLEEALLRYEASLRTRPNHTATLLGLIKVFERKGNLADACATQRRVCDLRPASGGQWRRLAMLHKAIGQLDEAREAAHRVVELDATGRAKAWFASHFAPTDQVTQIAALIERGRQDEARSLAFSLDFSDPQVFRSVSRSLGAIGREREDLLVPLVSIVCDAVRGGAHASDLADVLRKIAVNLSKGMQEELAAQVLDRAIELAPQSRAALFQKAMVLIALGQTSDALVQLGVLLESSPTDVITASRFGQLADIAQLAALADRLVPAVVQRARDDPGDRADAIRVLVRLMRFEQARALVDEAGLLDAPEMAQAAFELAIGTHDAGLGARALRERNWLPGINNERDAWRVALALLQADREGLALAYDRLAKRHRLDALDANLRNRAGMALGRYQEAFSGSTSSVLRDAIASLLPNLYRYGESLDALSSATVLIVAYTEVGDEIRLIDAVDRARTRFGKCTIAVDSRIAALVSRGRNDVEVIGVDKVSEIPPDLSVPLVLRRHMSRPLWERRARFDRIFLIGDVEALLIRTVDDLPHRRQFLEADDQLRRRWRCRLGELKAPRIGLFWRSARFGYRRVNRITSLKDWAPVFEACRGATFINLQYGAQVPTELSQVRRMANIVEMVGLDVKNALDSLAALMTELDLLITVPGAAQHLAGAMGVRTLAVTHPSQLLWRARPASNMGTWSPTVEVVSGPPELGFEGALAATAHRLRSILDERPFLR